MPARPTVSILCGLVLVALLAAPAAQAKAFPTVYYLKDAMGPNGERIPVGDGDLSTLPLPLPPDPNDPANTTRLQEQEGPSRTIYPLASAVAPVQFVANASRNTGRVYGVVYTILVLPKTPAMQNAVLNISLVALPKDPQVPPPLGGGGQVLAWARLPLNYTQSNLPNATRFVPENATSPQEALNQTRDEALAYGLTTLASWYAVAILDDSKKDYFIDATVEAGARLALRFVLENGTAYSPHPAIPPQQAPIPVGAGQPILYDTFLTGSYVFVPWYTQDPAPPPPTSTSKAPSSSTSGTATSGTGTSSKPAMVLPFGVLVAVALVGAMMARRRLA